MCEHINACLLYFTKKGNPKGVKLALKRGATKLTTAIQIALEKDQVVILELLLEQPKIKNNYDDFDLIVTAAEHGSLGVLQLLLALQSTENRQKELENVVLGMALQRAVASGRLNVVQFIVEQAVVSAGI